MTGSIVIIDDAIPFMPIEKILAQINPVQDLHGYDAPWPAGGGVNKLPYAESGTATNNGITVKSNGDGTYLITGTTGAESANPYFDLPSEYTIQDGDYIHLMNNVANSGVQLSLDKAGAGNVDYWTMSTANRIAAISGSKTGQTFDRIRVYVAANTSDVNITVKPMICKSSTAVSFAPYSNICPISGHTGLSVFCEEQYDQSASPKATVSWQDTAGTVYGGQDEVVRGELTSTLARIVFDGSLDEDWVKYGSSSAADYAMKILVPDFQFKQSTITAWSNYLQSIDNGKTWGNYDCFISFQNSTIVTGIRSITTVADWRAYLAQNPLEVVYLLATPQSFTHAPTQISTLEGQNNVWVDTGDVSVTYQSTSGSTPVKTSFKSPLKNYSYSALKMFSNTFIEHGKG